MEAFESIEAAHTPTPVHRPDLPHRASSPQLPQQQRSVPQQQRSVPPPPPAPQRSVPQFKFKPPSSTLSKRIIQPDDDDEDTMDLDVPEFNAPSINAPPPPPSTAAVQPPPTLNEPFQSPQKRVRVGLSKRTSSTLHRSTYPSVADIVPPPTVQLDSQIIVPEYDDRVMDHDQDISVGNEKR